MQSSLFSALRCGWCWTGGSYLAANHEIPGCWPTEAPTFAADSLAVFGLASHFCNTGWTTVGCRSATLSFSLSLSPLLRVRSWQTAKFSRSIVLFSGVLPNEHRALVTLGASSIGSANPLLLCSQNGDSAARATLLVSAVAHANHESSGGISPILAVHLPFRACVHVCSIATYCTMHNECFRNAVQLNPSVTFPMVAPLPRTDLNLSDSTGFAC